MKSPAILAAHNIMKGTQKNKRVHNAEAQRNVQSLDESLATAITSLKARFSGRVRELWKRLVKK